MGITNPKNIGSHIRCVAALVPQALAATAAANTANSTPVYNRLPDNYPLSMTLHLRIGAVTGAPTSFNVVAKVQDSADGTTFADYVPPPIAGTKQTLAPQTALSVVQTEVEVDVDLSGARQYIALNVNPTFVGGTSPTIQAAAVFVLGGPSVEPF
jgi:hypothetical protein